MILLKILGAWLLADFISGLVHWWEDRILTPDSRYKFLRSIERDNYIHHKKPTAMLKFTVSENINTTVVIAWPIALGLFLIGAPLILWLAMFFTGFGNLVHRFAHVHPMRISPLVGILQWSGLFISFHHHAGHHYDEWGLIDKENTTKRYCAMTNWVNPVLDRIRFFRFLEWIFRK